MIAPPRERDLTLLTSPATLAIADLVEKVARVSAPALICGESGVGKEVVARAIHAASPRRHGPFVKVNCAAVPAELLESEFFGHARGAFTHAHREKAGRFEHAHGGVLFLDEIAELAPELQAKLLHALQDREFFRVGGDRSITADVHVIGATNRDLEAAIDAGQFRSDLYYRINVIEIRVLPLRERREEIPALVEHYRVLYGAEYGRRVEIPPRLMRAFAAYAWPGNIRQLANVVRRFVLLGSVEALPPELRAALDGAEPHGPAALDGATRGHGAGPDAVRLDGAAERTGGVDLKVVARQAARVAERGAIAAALEAARWNRAKAARMLGVSYKALLYKLIDLGLVRREP